MATGAPVNPYDPGHAPKSPATLNLWAILGIALVIVVSVFTLAAAVIGGMFLLLKGVLSILEQLRRRDDDADGDGGELELAEIAQLPPAPRHDPHLKPVA